MSRKLQIAYWIAMPIVVAVVSLAALWLLGKSPTHVYWDIRERFFGPEKVGIWKPDPVLGWSHVPNSHGRQRNPPYFDFDVRYNIDEHGHRKTSGKYGDPSVLFLGDSFVFGHGVEDEQSFPEVVQRALPGYKVINAGMNGSGASQAWLALKRELRSRSDIKLVLYAYIDHDAHRNGLRKSWALSIWGMGRDLPRLEQGKDGITARGLIARDAPLVEDSEPTLEEREHALMIALIAEMKRECETRGVPFIVAHLPDPNATALTTRIGRHFPESFFDLAPAVDYRKYRFANNYHLNKEGNKRIAEAMVPIIRGALGKRAP